MSGFRSAMLAAACAAMTVLPSAFAAAQSLEQVYKGAQVKILSGFGPTSGYTVWARLVAAHLTSHLPGEPTIIVQSMIGAGGLKAAGYIYAQAPKDGKEIGAVAREVPALGIIGAQGANFDVTKFAWLGSPTSESNICVVSKSVPVTSPEDLLTREVSVGTDGIGSGMHIIPAALNTVLGTKFKIIDGYSESGEVLLALDRGEVDGACQSVETLMRARGDQIRSGALRVVLQGGVAPHPKFPNVPFAPSLAKTEEQRQVLEFLYAGQAFGRPLILPPDLPADRLAALRKAFGDTMRDPRFLEDAARQGLEVSPITGEEMQAMIARLAAMPKPVIAQVKQLMDPGQK